MLSSFFTTYLLSYIEEQPTFGSTYFFISPIDVAQDLIRAAIRILRDQDLLASEDYYPQFNARNPMSIPEPPGLFKRFVRRFVLGLPMIGAGSLMHMLFSMPVLAPLQWVARWRGNRSRRGNSTDMAATIIVVVIIIGAARLAISIHKGLCCSCTIVELCTRYIVSHGK